MMIVNILIFRDQVWRLSQAFNKNNILEYKSQDQNKESSTFLEERFGRNLDLSLAKDAEQALRRRIVSKINENSSASENSATEHDVYLYPSGMASILMRIELL